MRRYSDEERRFFINFVPGHSYKEIQQEYQKRFEKDITLLQIKCYISNNKLNTGRTGRFEKGAATWNKGKHFYAGGKSIETQFKKGHAPHNQLPVGTESVRDGYLYIKIKEPNKWALKHRLLWESVHGPLKKNQVLIFKNRNRMDVRIENLLLVSRNQLKILNQKGFISETPELTETGALVAELFEQIHRRGKNNENRRCGH